MPRINLNKKGKRALTCGLMIGMTAMLITVKILDFILYNYSGVECSLLLVSFCIFVVLLFHSKGFIVWLNKVKYNYIELGKW